MCKNDQITGLVAPIFTFHLWVAVFVDETFDPFKLEKSRKHFFLDQSVQDTARAWRLNVNLCPSESQNITSYIEKETNGLKLKFLFEKRD